MLHFFDIVESEFDSIVKKVQKTPNSTDFGNTKVKNHPKGDEGERTRVKNYEHVLH